LSAEQSVNYIVQLVSTLALYISQPASQQVGAALNKARQIFVCLFVLHTFMIILLGIGAHAQFLCHLVGL